MVAPLDFQGNCEDTDVSQADLANTKTKLPLSPFLEKIKRFFGIGGLPNFDIHTYYCITPTILDSFSKIVITRPSNKELQLVKRVPKINSSPTRKMVAKGGNCFLFWGLSAWNRLEVVGVGRVIWNLDLGGLQGKPDVPCAEGVAEKKNNKRPSDEKVKDLSLVS